MPAVSGQKGNSLAIREEVDFIAFFFKFEVLKHFTLHNMFSFVGQKSISHSLQLSQDSLD